MGGFIFFFSFTTIFSDTINTHVLFTKCGLVVLPYTDLVYVRTDVKNTSARMSKRSVFGEVRIWGSPHLGKSVFGDFEVRIS